MSREMRGRKNRRRWTLLLGILILGLLSLREVVFDDSPSRFLNFSAKDTELLKHYQRGVGVNLVSARPGRVIDGDTIKLSDGQTVRYLGIDTPEMDETFYDDAQNLNRRLLRSHPITVVSPREESHDGYRRLLGAVFVALGGESGDNTLLVNLELVRQGLAYVYIKDNDPVTAAMRPALIEAQNAAIDEKLGIWSLPGAIMPKRKGQVLLTRYRFHSPDCKNLNGRKGRLADRETALRTGRSPCRSCKP